MAHPAARPPAGAPRLAGVDAARALTLFGVVMNNWLVVLNAPAYWRGMSPRWLWSWTYPSTGALSTRFAATMVTLFGIGAGLSLQRAAARGPRATRDWAWAMVRRAVLLYVLGSVFVWAWPGEILHFYGLFALLLAGVARWRTRVLGALAALLVLATVPVQLARAHHVWADPDDRSLFVLRPSLGSPRAAVADWFVSGTHTVLPWVAFALLGLLLARADLHAPRTWARMAATGSALLVGGYTLSSFAQRRWHGDVRLLLRTDPLRRMPLYVVTTAGSTLLGLAVVLWVCERTPGARVWGVLAHGGRVTLSAYLLHGLAARAYVELVAHRHPHVGLLGALVWVAAFWVFAVVWGAVAERRWGGGPAELVERRIVALPR